jgi:gamma-glutamyltranspeptidase / glutathione hydrolase
VSIDVSLAQHAVFGRKEPASSDGGMVVCSHPIATRAAVDVLREGGNACDAALCAAITQTVVEPHMTTITGMLSLLHHDAASGVSSYLNGNVNAPIEPLGTYRTADALGPRGVATPGFWAAFEAAHERLGSMSRERLMAPAIELARDGFPIHPYLYGEGMYPYMAAIGRSQEAREMYMPDGALLSPGDTLHQSRAADTLERLCAEGSSFFYRGDFAADVVGVVREAGGVITREDFEAYEAVWDEPVRGAYRDADVVGSPPPDTGGAHLIEILNLVELLDLDGRGPARTSAEGLYWLARVCEEVRLDGARWNADVPIERLLSKEHAAQRLELMRATQPQRSLIWPPSFSSPPPGSNHVTVVDGAGNVVTMLHSCLSDAFGNGLWSGGIHVCSAGGHFLRTMPAPGRRASVFVAPNIVFRDGRPFLASGSPSGALLQCIVQNVINIVDEQQDIGTSVHRPRFGNSRGAGVMMEIDLGEELIEGVVARGLPVETVPPSYHPLGAFEGIVIDGTRLHACADPRRTGAAEGV